MRRFLRFLAMLILPVGAARALPEMATAPPVPDSLRIVVIGSSTAAGQGVDDPDSAWVERYRRFLTGLNPANEVINLAVSGYSTYQLQPSGFRTPPGRPLVDRKHNITSALALRPSAIIVNVPSNDAVSNFTILEQSENYERIAAEAARAGVPLWVSTTQPRDIDGGQRQNLITMRDWIRDRFAAHALDFWTGIAREDGVLAPRFDTGDGTHLNDDAHAVLFERVRDAGIPARCEQNTWLAGSSSPSSDVTVYPNPARGNATLRLRTGQAGTVHITVQDLLGREVLRERDRFAPAGDIFTRLHLAALPAGMYVCRVQSPDGTAQQRLLVTN